MNPIIVNMITVASLMTAGGVTAAEMPALAKKHNCDACHTIEKKKVGPAWRDISKAYNKVGATGSAVDPAAYKVSNRVSDVLAKDNSKSPEEWLLHKVSQGGAGNWGTMPMPANDANHTREADLRELIKFVLGLEKK